MPLGTFNSSLNQSLQGFSSTDGAYGDALSGLFSLTKMRGSLGEQDDKANAMADKQAAEELREYEKKLREEQEEADRSELRKQSSGVDAARMSRLAYTELRTIAENKAALEIAQSLDTSARRAAADVALKAYEDKIDQAKGNDADTLYYLEEMRARPEYQNFEPEKRTGYDSTYKALLNQDKGSVWNPDTLSVHSVVSSVATVRDQALPFEQRSGLLAALIERGGSESVFTQGLSPAEAATVRAKVATMRQVPVEERMTSPVLSAMEAELSKSRRVLELRGMTYNEDTKRFEGDPKALPGEDSASASRSVDDLVQGYYILEAQRDNSLRLNPAADPDARLGHRLDIGVEAAGQYVGIVRALARTEAGSRFVASASEKTVEIPAKAADGRTQSKNVPMYGGALPHQVAGFLEYKADQVRTLAEGWRDFASGNLFAEIKAGAADGGVEGIKNATTAALMSRLEKTYAVADSRGYEAELSKKNKLEDDIVAAVNRGIVRGSDSEVRDVLAALGPRLYVGETEAALTVLHGLEKSINPVAKASRAMDLFGYEDINGFVNERMAAWRRIEERAAAEEGDPEAQARQDADTRDRFMTGRLFAEAGLSTNLKPGETAGTGGAELADRTPVDVISDSVRNGLYGRGLFNEEAVWRIFNWTPTGRAAVNSGKRHEIIADAILRDTLDYGPPLSVINDASAVSNSDEGYQTNRELVVQALNRRLDTDGVGMFYPKNTQRGILYEYKRHADVALESDAATGRMNMLEWAKGDPRFGATKAKEILLDPSMSFATSINVENPPGTDAPNALIRVGGKRVAAQDVATLAQFSPAAEALADMRGEALYLAVGNYVNAARSVGGLGYKAGGRTAPVDLTLLDLNVSPEKGVRLLENMESLAKDPAISALPGFSARYDFVRRLVRGDQPGTANGAVGYSDEVLDVFRESEASRRGDQGRRYLASVFVGATGFAGAAAAAEEQRLLDALVKKIAGSRGVQKEKSGKDGSKPEETDRRAVLPEANEASSLRLGRDAAAPVDADKDPE